MWKFTKITFFSTLTSFMLLALVLATVEKTPQPASLIPQAQAATPLGRTTADPTVTRSATPSPAVSATASISPTGTATASGSPTAAVSATPAAPTIPASNVTPVVAAGAAKVPFADRFIFRKTDQVRYIKPGLIHLKRTETGPININLLLFDLTSPEFNMKVAFREDWLSGVARTSVLAKSNDALAGVNGDLFSSTGLPQGMSMTNGKLSSSPKRRATFAWSRTSGPFIGYFTQNFTWPARVISAKGDQHSLEILNNVCKQDWLCVYNDLYKQVPAGSDDTRVLLNSSNEVIEITRSELVRISEEQQVLLGRGQAGQWLLENVKVGDRLEMQFNTDPDYRQFQQIVSGGPVFLRNGAFVQDCLCFLEDCSESKQKEVICEEFTTDWKMSHYLTVRMPRNAVGYNIDKSVLIVAVVDGYQPGFSIGMTQRELSRLFLEFGADSAMELDGGGSATMYLEGKLASRPSDGGGAVERAVPNALLFFWDEGSDSSEPSTTQTAPSGTPSPKPATSPTPKPTARATPTKR